jgi:hypothetical protein
VPFSRPSAGLLNSHSLITHATARSIRESDWIAKLRLSERVRARESGHITENKNWIKGDATVAREQEMKSKKGKSKAEGGRCRNKVE